MSETELQNGDAARPAASSWVDALDKALCALIDLRRAPQHRDDPMLMIDVDRTANLLRQRISDGGSASTVVLIDRP